MPSGLEPNWLSILNKCTNFACASSRLWSVMVMIWWRMSPMSCFLPSPSEPSCPCGGGTAMPPCTVWPARVTPPRVCMIRACSSISSSPQHNQWASGEGNEHMHKKKQLDYSMSSVLRGNIVSEMCRAKQFRGKVKGMNCRQQYSRIASPRGSRKKK